MALQNSLGHEKLMDWHTFANICYLWAQKNFQMKIIINNSFNSMEVLTMLLLVKITPNIILILKIHILRKV
jgi:hypothetical protein